MALAERPRHFGDLSIPSINLSGLTRRLKETFSRKQKTPEEELRDLQAHFFGAILAGRVLAHEIAEKDALQIAISLQERGVNSEKMLGTYYYFTGSKTHAKWADPEFQREALGEFWPEFPQHPSSKQMA